MFKHKYMNFIVGMDVGGSHIAGALVNQETGELIKESHYQLPLNAEADAETILTTWVDAILKIRGSVKPSAIKGIGIAMPGPFDYERGISWIKNLGKYDSLYGINIAEALKRDLHVCPDFPIKFENDAVCFGLGESVAGAASSYRNVVALTLGTGLGAAFIRKGKAIHSEPDVPSGGTLYQIPFLEGIAEDYFSGRGLCRQYTLMTGKRVEEARMIYDLALAQEQAAIRVFNDFGVRLAAFLVPWLRVFRADCLVLGGSISKAACFFQEVIKDTFIKNNLTVEVMTSKLGENAAILGAASLLKDKDNNLTVEKLRQSNQPLLPLRKTIDSDDGYNIYPAFHLEEDKIFEGFSSLVDFIEDKKTVLIDGYVGVFWDKIADELSGLLKRKGLTICMQKTHDWFLSQSEIDRLVTPFLGENDSVWGKKCDKKLSDFFDKEKIVQCTPYPDADINIAIGCGASLASWDAPVIYIDLPKNELQYRMRAGSITNLGSCRLEDDVQMYKRFYFVDWVVLNKHKKDIVNRIKIMVDSQRLNTITWMYFDDIRHALKTMSENVFRVRPWFEPGAWGGQWMKKNIQGLNPGEVNYAWSFELITPENGLILESNNLLLEVSFDFLMFMHNDKILGKEHAGRFRDEFPIRFDFLDTVDGGNLSIQCHPSVAYIKENFGEDFTQDETYYILDADKDAAVYLGFNENIDPEDFREKLEESNRENTPVEITDYVQYHRAKKHDLFLIPNGTVHSAGEGNLVLEISATPYIFTFKMYDWLRLDLNGKARPINIEHAFNNLIFDRKGEKVKKELISKPYVLNSGPGWKQIHLPTHREHFYDIHRYEFNEEVQIQTNGSCHVLMLVEGTSILVETKSGYKQRLHYAETFVVPEAAKSYILINVGKGEAKVVKAFLKK